MKIATLAVERYRPRADGAPAGYSAEILVVRVETDNGPTGTGFASAAPGTAPLITGMIEKLIAPAIKGEDPRRTERVWNRMHAAVPRRGGEGLMRLATAAVDFALWDIKGKAASVPVATLVGGLRDRVATYANCAHHMPPDKLAAKAAEDVSRGHRALKIRGTRSFVTPAEATERVRAVREAVGPDIRLMVDVNGSWDVDTAVQQLKAWERYDIYWLEEPVPPHDLDGYRRVRDRAGGTYIVGGEQHVGLGEFRQLIDTGAADIVQPNAAITGGITDWLRIHAYATARGVPVSPWNLQAVHLHLAAGLPNVQWIEYFMPDNALQSFQTRLFVGPKLREETTPEGVFLRAPEAPGLGLELDPAMAEESRISE